MKIAFIFNKGRKSRLEKINRFESPSEFFYGAIELSKKKHSLGYFEVDLEIAPGIFGGIINILGGMGLCPEKFTGSALEQVKGLLEQLKEYDVIVASTSGIGYAMCFWKIFSPKIPPIISIHCGLLNNQYNYLRRLFSSFLLKKAKTVLFGEGELAPMINMFDINAKMVCVNQFGVDKNFWFPAGKRSGDYVLSVGNDGRRDFVTLVRAAAQVSIDFKILTARAIPEVLPSNVELLRSSWHNQTISDVDLRSLYQNAKCVVITLIESSQPSGQSVALQAMACGCPVIITTTSGLWSKENLIDGENVIFVLPGETLGVVEKIRLLLEDQELCSRLSINGRKLIENHANIDFFAANLEKLCMRTCGGA